VPTNRGESGGGGPAAGAVAGAGRLRPLVEILAIAAIFAAAGAWPAPDVNEAVYLTKARHAADPQWGAGDFFLESPDAHGVFYFLLGPLAAGLPLETAAWLGRIAGWLALAAGFRHLAGLAEGRLQTCPTTVGRTCSLPHAGRGMWAMLLAAAVFSLALRHTTAAGEWVIGGCEAKVFAWALVFGGLGELVRGRFATAWLLLGVATAFHPIVGGWAMLAAAAVRSTTPWPAPAGSSLVHRLLLAAGVVAALVGVVPAVLLNAGIDPAVRAEAARIYVAERLPHHLLVRSFATGFVARHVLAAVAWWLLTRLVPPTQARGRLTAFTLAALAISLVGVVISAAEPWGAAAVHGLLRYYWFRLGDVVVPLALAIFVAAALADDATLRRVVPLAPRAVRLVATLLLAADLAGESAHWPLPGRALVPRADAKVEAAAWAQVCDWVREHAPADACLLTPRGAASLTWRTGRREVVSWKNSPQDAASLVEWRRRIADCFSADGSLRAMTRSTASLGAERMRDVARRYGADLAIVPVATPGIEQLPFPRLHANDGYAVFDLTE